MKHSVEGLSHNLRNPPSPARQGSLPTTVPYTITCQPLSHFLPSLVLSASSSTPRPDLLLDPGLDPLPLFTFALRLEGGHGQDCPVGTQ